jgi:hypothetical protein
MAKRKTVKRGVVRKIIKPVHPSLPEKAEIMVPEADDLYRELRIDNALEDSDGKKHKLKEYAEVEVIVEADPAATVPEANARADEAEEPLIPKS